VHGAQAVGRDADLGSIEVGKVADLVVTRGNPLETIALLRSPWLIVQSGDVIHGQD
jgi:imidazolonepropionase-like amidohydrolase